MTKQVVVTGIGVFCPLGQSVDEIVAGLLSNKSKIGTIKAFETSHLTIRHAAEIVDYSPLDYFSESDSKRLDRTAQFGILAARSAVKDAKLSEEDISADSLGFVVGICAGGQGDPPHSQKDPFAIRLDDFPETAIFTQSEAIASDLGLHGPQCVLSTACASSGSAIGVALEMLRTGQCKRVLVGGTDAFSVPTYAGFYALGAMASQPTSPFSEGIGVTFGEGAGFVILESHDSAIARNANIYGELMGCGLTGDSHHVTSPHPGGEGLNRAMRLGLKQANITPDQVDYFNAHGTGTRDNDSAETQAIRQLYENVTDVPPVSSSKSFFGHTLGAAGILEFIVCILASKESFIPATINYTSPRQGCDLDYVPNKSRDQEVKVFVSNSAAFGGINAAVVGGQLRKDYTEPPIERDEVWITGTGVVSPIGCGNQEFYSALLAGTSGIKRVESFDVAGFRTQHAAIVSDFNPRKLIPTVDTRRAETMNRYAIVAAGLALQSGNASSRSMDPTRLGMVMALTYGSISVQEDFRQSLKNDGIEKLSAKYFPSMVVSTIGGQVSLAFKLQGINNTVVSGTTSGLSATAHGYQMMRDNSDQDAMVIVGADEVGQFMLRVFGDRCVTAKSTDEPFSLEMYGDSSGSVLGEGGGALLIERASVAQQRGAKPLARIRGIGQTNDGAAFQKIEGTGKWLSLAIEKALADANITINDVDWILTHGRGIAEYDAREIAAINAVFGNACPPVSCIAGNVGVGGASMGMFSLVAAVQGIQQGAAFPTVSTSASHASGLPLIRNAPVTGKMKNVLVIGSTEHGTNTALVLDTVE